MNGKFTLESLQKLEKQVKRNRIISLSLGIILLVTVIFLVFFVNRYNEWHKGEWQGWNVLNTDTNEIVYDSELNVKRVEGFNSESFDYLGPVYVDIDY